MNYIFLISLSQVMLSNFQTNWSARMDFLATYAAVNLDGALISKEITSIMGCQVGLSKDLYGSDLHAKSTSGMTM